MMLEQAVRKFVEPGMHLHFASTPSRSNAAVREVARAFAGRDPGFTISATGFHSMLHLLAILRLGRRYVGCFFGDNWPAPRPNALYTRLAQEGATLEHWSLLAYVAALRAGALGDRWAIARSLAGTGMAAELAAAGRYREIGDAGLVAALRPDVTFLHAAAADPDGHVLSTPPYGEGVWGALAAQRGVIVTVEERVSRSVTRRHPEALRLPPERVLAICEEPGGAHPQPLYTPPALELASYADDFAHYAVWRKLAVDDGAFARFVAQVLDARDGQAAYREWAAAAAAEASPEPGPAAEQLVAEAARWIERRVRAGGARAILAGIGHAFEAARLAARRLAGQGVKVPLLVETGLLDMEPAAEASRFLLSWDNMGRCRRLGAVEDALGVLACGADNRCLAVIGAAQVDEIGDLNSTRLADGRILVGSGGAADLAAAAGEVVVVVPAERGRLVDRVPYVTSRGSRVRSIVTDAGILWRDQDGDRWTLADFPHDAGVAPLRVHCPWPFDVSVGRAA